METKANYVLIGLFSLLGALGTLGLLLWLAKVEADRQYTYYDILFSDVAGLGAASDVRYNGLPVGQVIDLRLDDEDPSQVRVQIEVGADTPIKSDTIAQLKAQGVTGVSYVALSGGSAGAPPLPEGGAIRSERSALQSVFEGAPELLERAITLLENVNGFFDDKNRTAVATILENLSTSSGRLDSALGDFELLSSDLRVAAQEVATFANRLEKLGDTAETTLTDASSTLKSAGVAFEDASNTLATVDTFTKDQLTPLATDLRETVQNGNRVIDSVAENANIVAERLVKLADDGEKTLATATDAMDRAGQAFDSANDTIATIDTFTKDQLTPLATEMRSTVQNGNRVIDGIGENADVITERLTALADDGEATLATATDAMDRAGQAFDSATQTIATIDTFTTDQLDPLATEMRAAVNNGNRVIDSVGENADVITGRLQTLADESSDALATATRAFENALETLALIDTAMVDASETLETADQTFSMTNKLIEEDIDGIIADLRGAATAFTTAVEDAAGNIDAISDEVLAASRSAASFTDTLDNVVSGNERQVSEFLRLGLPEFLRFTEEARRLVVNLERLVSRIERDPARFLLGTQNSEFRR